MSCLAVRDDFRNSFMRHSRKRVLSGAHNGGSRQKSGPFKKFEEQLTLGALRLVRGRLVSRSPWKSHTPEARRYASLVIAEQDRPASIATWIQRLTQVVV